MFAGYLQAAAYKNLSDVGGLEGWRWLFIICTIITIPVCLLGFFVFPDLPHRKKPYFLTEAQHNLSRSRLHGITAPAQIQMSKTIFKRVWGRWHWYVLVFHWCLLDQNSLAAGTPFSLYLKAKSSIYSVTQINTLPTITTAISVICAIAAGFVADKTGKFWIPSVLATIPVFIGALLLVSWNVGESGRLAGFMIIGTEGVLSPMSMSWTTTLLANDAAERAIVTASMNAIGQAFTAWTQLFQYPATEAPNFHKGFISFSVTAALQFVTIGTIYFLARRELHHKVKTGEIEETKTTITEL
ncbi:major facilitator superfamily domain-containing protein [Exophiala viscosa]|uniref:Major facilitator superfamily domain-containing protein n=1 Tax=Exophiala viscosa TaxID=2486360 RepID=A0AAN6DN99_9EURO|nr:major facilitator superfamily domain-containing protein [Exophiala viscosa]